MVMKYLQDSTDRYSCFGGESVRWNTPLLPDRSPPRLIDPALILFRWYLRAFSFAHLFSLSADTSPAQVMAGSGD